MTMPLSKAGNSLSFPASVRLNYQHLGSIVKYLNTQNVLPHTKSAIVQESLKLLFNSLPHEVQLTHSEAVELLITQGIIGLTDRQTVRALQLASISSNPISESDVADAQRLFNATKPTIVTTNNPYPDLAQVPSVEKYNKAEVNDE